MATAISEVTKTAIVAESILGLPNTEIATKHGIHPSTISRILAPLKTAVAEGELTNYKHDLKVKSIKAIAKGLDITPEDSPEIGIKRGTLGVSVMKGIGEFSDQTTALVGVLVQTMPASFASEALTLPALVSPASPASIEANVSGESGETVSTIDVDS